jgi:hypothetical protein
MKKKKNTEIIKELLSRKDFKISKVNENEKVFKVESKTISK